MDEKEQTESKEDLIEQKGSFPLQSWVMPWEKEPDFVNDEGVKWWLDKETTQYARREDRNGISLEATCFYVEEPNGRMTRVLVSKDQEIIEEDQKAEGMGCKIDVRKFLKHEETKA